MCYVHIDYIMYTRLNNSTHYCCDKVKLFCKQYSFDMCDQQMLIT